MASVCRVHWWWHAWQYIAVLEELISDISPYLFLGNEKVVLGRASRLCNVGNMTREE
jgi:hypothetical protein